MIIVLPQLSASLLEQFSDCSEVVISQVAADISRYVCRYIRIS